MAAEKKRPALEGSREGDPAGPALAPPSFEAAIERLETLVNELESGELTLEESIARYEEGIQLSRQLTHTLAEAEKRIERLTAGVDGAPTTEPMELDPATPDRAPPEGKLPF